MSAPDNPPAFPTRLRSTWDGTDTIPGMTLRDYFAGKALPVVLTGFLDDLRSGRPCPENWKDGVTQEAYQIADSMLQARAQPKEEGK